MNSQTARAAFLPAFAGLCLLLPGCADHPIARQDAAFAADRVDARGLFDENCIVCHGKNGRAHTFHGWLVGAQNLTDPQWQAETTEAQIIHAITTGPRVMPAFGKRLSASEIQALAAYVRTFNKTN
jgi:mono/diheme cytochrome c family protein